MPQFIRTFAAIAAILACAAPALAQSFTLTPLTVVTPQQPGTILINGTVSLAPGQTLIPPLTNSSFSFPWLPDNSAAFNALGSGAGFNATFLAWNGVGTYAGPIFDQIVSPFNTGYTPGGMPLGLYGGTPAGRAEIAIAYRDVSGADRVLSASYMIEVVPLPTPGAAALLGLGGLIATRRRR